MLYICMGLSTVKYISVLNISKLTSELSIVLRCDYELPHDAYKCR